MFLSDLDSSKLKRFGFLKLYVPKLLLTEAESPDFDKFKLKFFPIFHLPLKIEFLKPKG